MSNASRDIAIEGDAQVVIPVEVVEDMTALLVHGADATPFEGLLPKPL